MTTITNGEILAAVQDACRRYSAQHTWSVTRLALADTNDDDIPWELQDAARDLRVTTIGMPAPTGPRLHPKHSHDVDGRGDNCFDLGCPAWCWSVR